MERTKAVSGQRIAIVLFVILMSLSLVFCMARLLRRARAEKEALEAAAAGTAKGVLIVFDAADGTTCDPMEGRLEGEEYGTLPETKRKGYRFDGWYTDAHGGKEVSGTDLIRCAENTVVLHAHWTLRDYRITYKLKGGKNSGENPDTYQITSDTIVLKAPTKDGWIFDGWYSDAQRTERVDAIESGSTGNLTFYAKWIETESMP